MTKPLTKKMTIFLAAAVALLAVAGTISAHHSPTMFNTATAVTIQGFLLRFELANPHSFLYVQQETADGKVEWAVEGPAPSQLVRRGLELGSFLPGGTVEACGYVMKDDAERAETGGKRVLVAEVLVMPDGNARLWSPYGNEHCREQNRYSIADQ